MSGHSKWSTIKRKKELRDAKKGKSFTRMANLIAIAAREGGSDPETNFKLRLTIDKAKSCNVPTQNIERAIKKGTGELGGAVIEQITYEAYGPSGIAVIIETLTDSKNRTVSELRKLLGDFGGRLVENGSVSWMFERKNVIRVSVDENKPLTSDDLTLKALDCGANDVEVSGGDLLISCKTSKLQTVKNCLETAKIKIEGAGIEMIAKNLVKLDDNAVAKVENFLDALEERDDIAEIYTNLG